MAGFDVISIFKQESTLLGAVAGVISCATALQQPKATAKIHAIFATGLPLALRLQNPEDFTLKHSTSAVLAFFSVIFTAVLIYRAFFHDLNRFPGPFIARLTDLHWVPSSNNGGRSRKVTALHQKYGDYVRIGPNSLSIRDADALPVMYGAKGWKKGEWYEKGKNISGKGLGIAGLALIRDITEHKRRRRTWDHGFTSTALASYQPVVRGINAKLVDGIQRRGKTETVDLAKEMSYYAWSVMYMVGFGGHGVDLIKDGVDKDNAIAGLASSVHHSLLLHYAPQSLLPLFRFTQPKLAQGFVNLVTRQWEARSGDVTMDGDVMGVLLEAVASETDPVKKERLMMEAMIDTRVVIIAGADTTSSAMSGIWYYMLSEPGKKTYKALRAALDDTYAEVDVLDHVELARQVPLLDAVIFEAQRLSPSVPSGPLFREAPKNGAVFGGHFIPAGTNAFIPLAPMGRDPRYFKDPEVYRPERWFNGEPINKNAFEPFSIGPRACVGRVLAMQEMRLLTSDILRSCDLDLVPNFDGQAWIDSWEDFTVSQIKGNLEVIVRTRV